MSIQSLISTEKSENSKMVAVKLPESTVVAIQEIRKATGRTNAEIYDALLGEGIKAYQTAVKVEVKPSNGRRRGRPRKTDVEKPQNGRRRGRKPKAD